MKTTYLLSGVAGGLLWLAAGGGCGDDPPERRPDQPLQSYGASATRIALNVTGPASDQDKGQRCIAVWQEAGVGVDPAAPVRVTLFLQDNGNRLQVASASRGVLRDEPRPGWGMAQLCQDALAAALPEVAREQGGAPPPAYAANNGTPVPPPPPPPPAMTNAPAGAAPPPALLPPVGGAPPAVTELGNRGQSLYARGDYAGALTSFIQAAKLSGDPNMIFDVGVTHYTMSHPREALQHFQIYLERAPSAPNRDQTSALIAQLHGQLGEP